VARLLCLDFFRVLTCFGSLGFFALLARLTRVDLLSLLARFAAVGFFLILTHLFHKGFPGIFSTKPMRDASINKVPTAA